MLFGLKPLSSFSSFWERLLPGGRARFVFTRGCGCKCRDHPPVEKYNFWGRSDQHQITPSKHTHGTTCLVLKSLGPILCNNPPLNTSKFPTFLGEPFCSPVSPPSFIFPPVPAPPLINGIDIFVMLDFSFFRNFVFSGCPVWPRFAPSEAKTQTVFLWLTDGVAMASQVFFLSK